MPAVEPLSPELVLVAPPEEARRARAGLAREPQEAAQASDERTEQVRRAWERLAERRLEQPEQPWERVVVRAAAQVERAREQIAVRASELAHENWSSGEADDPSDEVAPVEAVADVDDDPVEAVDEPAAPDWDEFLVRMRSDPVDPVTPDEPAAEPPALSRSPRRRVAVAVGIVLVLAFLAGVAWARDWFHGNPSSARTSAPANNAPRQATSPTRAQPKPKPVQKKPAATSSAKPKKQVSAAPARPKRTRKSAPARARTAPFVPARSWSWPSVQGSSRYRVRFFRNGGKVLDTRTTKPRLVLPKDFTFRAGRYRWTVVPISAQGKALRPIVDSTFVVSKR